MTIILCLFAVIVISLVLKSRSGLENALPIFCFFLVLMPLEARLVLPGLFDVNTMRISLLTLLGLYFYRGEAPVADPLPLRNLMVLHVIWAVCSTLYSISVATSAKQLISQVIEYYLLYFLVVRTITSIETIYDSLFAIEMAMAVCCIFALLEAYASYSILRIFPSNLWITYNGGVDPLYVEWGRGLRVRSTFPHPILFGDALAMCIPVSLYLLSAWSRGWKRVLLWFGLGLMFWAIYKTSSRGPWMATALCLGLLFLLSKNKVRQYLLGIAVVAMTILVARPGVWSTIDGLYQASTDASSPVGSSYLYRDALTEAVREAVAKEPGRALLGYGLGTFRELGLDITFLGSTQRWYTCDDNWAAFLYETGYVGLLLIGALLMRVLWLIGQAYLSLESPQRELSAVLLISLVGFYFLLLSVAGYSWGQQGYLNWILISLAISHSRLLSGEPAQSRTAADAALAKEPLYDLNVA